jgi:hypothetical protein
MDPQYPRGAVQGGRMDYYQSSGSNGSGRGFSSQGSGATTSSYLQPPKAEITERQSVHPPSVSVVKEMGFAWGCFPCWSQPCFHHMYTDIIIDLVLYTDRHTTTTNLKVEAFPDPTCPRSLPCGRTSACHRYVHTKHLLHLFYTPHPHKYHFGLIFPDHRCRATQDTRTWASMAPRPRAGTCGTLTVLTLVVFPQCTDTNLTNCQQRTQWRGHNI